MEHASLQHRIIAKLGSASEGRLGRAVLVLAALCSWALPLFAAYFVYGPIESGIFSEHFLKLHAVFLLLFPAWGLLRRSVLWRLVGTAGKSWLPVVVIVIGAGFVLVLLTAFRSLASPEFLAIVLAAMTIGALADAAAVRNNLSLALPGWVLYYSSIGTISFFLRTGEPRLWQPYLFSLGLGCMVALVPLARIFRQEGGTDGDASPNSPLLARMLPLVVVLGPLLPATLVYASQLPPRYLALFAVLPFALPCATPSNEAPGGSRLSPRRVRLLPLISTLYGALLLAVRLL